MPYLTSDLLRNIPWIKHGFFTREKGVSTGIYAGRNCGPGSNDKQENIQQNRAFVLQELGANERSTLLSCYQIHSNKVHDANITWDVFDREDCPQADAMVTHTDAHYLGVLTADCAPILFADTTQAIIAAAHAGWKGAVSGVIDNTLHAMTQQGAKLENIVAVVGPCIAQASYEVGRDFQDTFLANNPDYAGCFIIQNAKIYFDLKAFVALKLSTANIADYDILSHDTYQDAQRFYSYRRTTHRSEKDYGRLISVIGLDLNNVF